MLKTERWTATQIRPEVIFPDHPHHLPGSGFDIQPPGHWDQFTRHHLKEIREPSYLNEAKGCEGLFFRSWKMRLRLFSFFRITQRWHFITMLMFYNKCLMKRCSMVLLFFHLSSLTWRPGGRDCFNFSAFSLSLMTSVYRKREHRTWKKKKYINIYTCRSSSATNLSLIYYLLQLPKLISFPKLMILMQRKPFKVITLGQTVLTELKQKKATSNQCNLVNSYLGLCHLDLINQSDHIKQLQLNKKIINFVIKVYNV